MQKHSYLYTKSGRSCYLLAVTIQLIVLQSLAQFQRNTITEILKGYLVPYYYLLVIGQ